MNVIQIKIINPIIYKLLIIEIIKHKMKGK